jgi:hypothetical protein
MKMDRDVTDDGLGKYAVINLRKLNETCGNAGTFQRWTPEVQAALDTLESVGVLEWGRTGEPDEFFLIKLKDQHAMHALMAYHASAYKDDREFADEVRQMALRSGPFHPLCKKPD